jgi:hypothetical protein
MSGPPAPPGSVVPAESAGRTLVKLLLLVLVPMGVCAALVHWVLEASWLKSCLWSPVALAAFLVWAWVQKTGQSGSYGAYQAIEKQLGRKP